MISNYSFKIISLIKQLRKKGMPETIEEAYQLIYDQFKMDEVLVGEEMDEVGTEINHRLHENWPFKNKV